MAAADDTISWRQCGQIECATFVVPLDYAKPNGKTIQLSLIRIKARNPDQRIGVLIGNPGGPGASANDFTRIWQALLAGDIRNRFDIVSFDPRGVGESSPIDCHDNLQALIAVDPDPDTDAEWQEAKAESKEFADNCESRYGDILPYLGTKNVARDMDAIRAALGEEKINYLGYSYGTSIGGVYADMFPSHIRSMVLDGGTDLSLSFEDVNRTQMIGFERAFDAYLANCKATSCALAKNGEPRAAVQAIIAAAEAKPIPAKNADRPAGPGEVQLGIISAMYNKLSWPSSDAGTDRRTGRRWHRSRPSYRLVPPARKQRRLPESDRGEFGRELRRSDLPEGSGDLPRPGQEIRQGRADVRSFGGDDRAHLCLLVGHALTRLRRRRARERPRSS